ncbi:MAG TPA: transporter substrate-binding domain-containing protein [Chloroflexota bacterium]
MRRVAAAALASLPFLAFFILTASAGPGPRPLVLGVATSVNLNTAFADASTGELRGVGAELVKAFAAELGTDIEQVRYTTTPAIMADVNSGAWEISVQPGDQARAGGALYGGTYMLVQQTLLVPTDSSARTMADLDQPGVRIVVNVGTPADAELSRLLQHAELIRNDAPGTGSAAPLFAGEVDAYAFNREALLGLAEQRAGYRVLDDDFAVTELGIAVAPGQQQLLGHLQTFLDDAKRSGLVARAIQTNGVRGVEVASPGQ